MKYLSSQFFRVLLLAACFGIPVQSCTDLEPEIFSDLTSDNFPQTQTDVVSTYLAVYTRLYPMLNHGGYMSIQEISSDEMMIPQRGSDWFDGGIWLRTHRQAFDANDPQFNGAWSFLYLGVLEANRAINIINDFADQPEEEKAPLIAELRSLRAYFYFLLTDSFGNVPLITETSDPTDLEPMAATRSEIFNFVVNELEESSSELTRDKGTDTYGKINYWTNRALLSRVLLNAEALTGTARYADAAAAADEVINSGLYSLTDDYFDNFDADNDNGFNSTSENIWVIPYDEPAVAGGFNIPQQTLHYQSQQTFNLQEQPWNGYCTLQEFYESYDSTDLRRGVPGTTQPGNFLVGPQYEADGVTPIGDSSGDDPIDTEFERMAQDMMNDENFNAIEFTPRVNALEPNAFRQAGARAHKFLYSNGSPSTLRNDFPIIRYSEVLLNKAEAMMRMGDAGASMLVNMVRSRAGLEDFGEDMTMDDLLAERGREFFYEGTRRQDLIRFDKFTAPWSFKGATSEDAHLFPIPQPQLNANRNLVQNPGYGG
jgi:hypothetical protein